MRVDGTIYPFSDAAPLLMGAAVFGCRCELPDITPCHTAIAAAVHISLHDSHGSCAWARESGIGEEPSPDLELLLMPVAFPCIDGTTCCLRLQPTGAPPLVERLAALVQTWGQTVRGSSQRR